MNLVILIDTHLWQFLKMYMNWMYNMVGCELSNTLSFSKFLEAHCYRIISWLLKFGSESVVHWVIVDVPLLKTNLFVNFDVKVFVWVLLLNDNEHSECGYNDNKQKYVDRISTYVLNLMVATQFVFIASCNTYWS